jgi:hypothetical protein
MTIIKELYCTGPIPSTFHISSNILFVQFRNRTTHISRSQRSKQETPQRMPGRSFPKKYRESDFRLEPESASKPASSVFTSAGVGGVTGFQPPAGNRIPDRSSSYHGSESIRIRQAKESSEIPIFQHLLSVPRPASLPSRPSSHRPQPSDQAQPSEPRSEELLQVR